MTLPDLAEAFPDIRERGAYVAFQVITWPVDNATARAAFNSLAEKNKAKWLRVYDALLAMQRPVVEGLKEPRPNTAMVGLLQERYIGYNAAIDDATRALGMEEKP